MHPRTGRVPKGVSIPSRGRGRRRRGRVPSPTSRSCWRLRSVRRWISRLRLWIRAACAHCRAGSMRLHRAGRVPPSIVRVDRRVVRRAALHRSDPAWLKHARTAGLHARTAWLHRAVRRQRVWIRTGRHRIGRRLNATRLRDALRIWPEGALHVRAEALCIRADEGLWGWTGARRDGQGDTLRSGADRTLWHRVGRSARSSCCSCSGARGRVGRDARGRLRPTQELRIEAHRDRPRRRHRGRVCASQLRQWGKRRRVGHDLRPWLLPDRWRRWRYGRASLLSGLYHGPCELFERVALRDRVAHRER